MGVVPNGSAGVTPGVAGALGQTGTSSLKGRTQASVTSTLKGDVSTPSSPGGSIGGSWLDVFNFGGLLGSVNDKADTVSNEIISISAEQVAANERLDDLEDITGTGVTTPIWSSAGGKDLVSFPRVLMQPQTTGLSGTTNTEPTHRHTYNASGSGSSSALTGAEGAHSHTITASNFTSSAPAFVQTHGTVDFAFVRGGVDRQVEPKVVKIITGADTSFFDVTAWYLGLYVLRTSDNVMVKVWDSGNLASVLSSQRQAYNIGTGLTNTFIQPDHLLAVASLQIATGGLRRPRGLGCIFQTGIAEAAGTMPPAPHGYVNGQTTLPGGVGIYDGFFNWDRNKIMWAAVGESS